MCSGWSHMASSLRGGGLRGGAPGQSCGRGSRAPVGRLPAALLSSHVAWACAAGGTCEAPPWWRRAPRQNRRRAGQPSAGAAAGRPGAADAAVPMPRAARIAAGSAQSVSVWAPVRSKADSQSSVSSSSRPSACARALLAARSQGQ